MEPLLPLELLRCGDWAEVSEVSGATAWVARLAELGIRPGSRLQVLRAGSPCLLLVGGTRLSLRGDEAMQILVRTISTTVPVSELPRPALGECC